MIPDIESLYGKTFMNLMLQAEPESKNSIDADDKNITHKKNNSNNNNHGDGNTEESNTKWLPIHTSLHFKNTNVVNWMLENVFLQKLPSGMTVLAPELTSDSELRKSISNVPAELDQMLLSLAQRGDEKGVTKVCIRNYTLHCNTYIAHVCTSYVHPTTNLSVRINSI